MDSHKEKVKLKLAVEQFVKAMVKRLYAKVDEGYTGWSDRNNFFQIAGDMFADVASYTRWEIDYLPVCIDIANRAMMLYHMGLGESKIKEENPNKKQHSHTAIANELERWICENPTRWTAVKELSPVLSGLLEKIALQQ